MQRIYLDNAATTPLDKEVLDAMLPYLTTHFGNPSSIYSYGRETRLAIETARKSVAGTLGAKPGEIFFTSGGTESNNSAIAASVRDLNCTHILTSAIEHHAVLHTVQHFHTSGLVSVSYVDLLEDGGADYEHLEGQLQELSNKRKKCLVSLMHANNEIGTLLDLAKAGKICEKYGAVFHSDCVQTVGHYPIDLQHLKVHFISAASHKFHGPKGVGVLYVKDGVPVKPFIFGGGQERNMRAGTENVHGIVGFTKALQIAERDYLRDSTYIKGLKEYMMDELKKEVPHVSFNGDAEGGLYTVLSASFKKTDKSDFVLLNLDINNICVSGGSACSSGTDMGSHVIEALGKAEQYATIRFSFSKYNTRREIDIVVEELKKFI